MLQSGPAWCRTAPIPFTEFARETRRLAWRERARNVLSQGRRRARNIGAPPPAPPGAPRRSAPAPRPARARLPAPTPNPPRARRRPRSALPVGAERTEEGGTAFRLNRSPAASGGPSRPPPAEFALLAASAARRLCARRGSQASTRPVRPSPPPFFHLRCAFLAVSPPMCSKLLKSTFRVGLDPHELAVIGRGGLASAEHLVSFFQALPGALGVNSRAGEDAAPLLCLPRAPVQGRPRGRERLPQAAGLPVQAVRPVPRAAEAQYASEWPL